MRNAALDSVCGGIDRVAAGELAATIALAEIYSVRKDPSESDKVVPTVPCPVRASVRHSLPRNCTRRGTRCRAAPALYRRVFFLDLGAVLKYRSAAQALAFKYHSTLAHAGLVGSMTVRVRHRSPLAPRRELALPPCRAAAHTCAHRSASHSRGGVRRWGTRCCMGRASSRTCPRLSNGCTLRPTGSRSSPPCRPPLRMCVRACVHFLAFLVGFRARDVSPRATFAHGTG